MNLTLELEIFIKDFLDNLCIILKLVIIILNVKNLFYLILLIY